MSATITQTVRMHQRDADICAAYRAGLRSPASLGAMFGVTERTAQRALIRGGIRQVRPAVNPAHHALRELLADGMPANWASETVGTSYNVAVDVARTMPNRRENVREWDEAWKVISRDPKLRRLHDEIAPPSAKAA